MPGMPFLASQPSYQGVQGEGAPSQRGGSGNTGPGWSFFLWLVVLGVIVPVAILGTLRAGGFQFVFRKR